MWLCWRVVEGVLASRVDGRGDSKTGAPSWTWYLNTSDAYVCIGWPHGVQLEWVVKSLQPTHPAAPTSPLVPPHLSFFSLETRRDFSSRYFSTTALRVRESGRRHRMNYNTPKVTELLCCASERKGQMWKLVDNNNKKKKTGQEAGKKTTTDVGSCCAEGRATAAQPYSGDWRATKVLKILCRPLQSWDVQL